MTDAEIIAQLRAEVEAARTTRDSYAMVARLAVVELQHTRELLDSMIDALAKCTCQAPPSARKKAS